MTRIEDLNHKRLEYDEWWDTIQIRLEPRFKTSPLSGNEWRASAVVDFFRKGHAIYSKRFSNVKAAVAWLPWGLLTVGEAEDIDLPDNADYCAQPGCEAKAETFYQIKKLYDNGREAEYQYPAYRGYCGRHSERGDSDLEDQDDNLVWIAGAYPSADTANSDDAHPAALIVQDIDEEESTQ